MGVQRLEKGPAYWNAVRSEINKDRTGLRESLLSEEITKQYQVKQGVATEKFLGKLPKYRKKLEEKIEQFSSKAAPSYAEWQNIMMECFIAAVIFAKVKRLEWADPSYQAFFAERGLDLLAAILPIGTPLAKGSLPGPLVSLAPMLVKLKDAITGTVTEPESLISFDMEVNAQGKLTTKYYLNNEEMGTDGEPTTEALVKKLDTGVVAFLKTKGFDISPNTQVVHDQNRAPITQQRFQELVGEYKDLYETFASEYFGMTISGKPAPAANPAPAA